jgi:HSP20 family protein
MMKLVRYETPALDPLASVADLREEMGRWFDFAFSAGGRGATVPAIDVYRDQETFVLRAELPGVRKEDVSLEVTDGVLQLSGERKSEETPKEGESAVREISPSRFSRSIALPDEVQADKIEARFENGLLTVRLPKRAEAKPQKIAINVQ